jgi:hypothetical protein
MKTLTYLLIAICGSAHALIYDEAILGDLSGDGLAPTPLVFDVGVNIIRGTMGTAGPQLDADIFTITLEPGQFITEILLVEYDHSGVSFYAISGGQTITMDSPDNHLSNALIGTPGDILPQLAFRSFAGGLGLARPIPAGTYTMWFQETGGLVEYEMAYTVVPEPVSGLLAVTGLALVCARRRGGGRTMPCPDRAWCRC